MELKRIFFKAFYASYKFYSILEVKGENRENETNTYFQISVTSFTSDSILKNGLLSLNSKK